MKSFILGLAVPFVLLNSLVADGGGIAAKVAPAQTFALVAVHDLQRTAERWKETAFAKILQEPEWKAFTVKLGALLDEIPKKEVVIGVLDEIAKVGPSGAFFAVGEMPDFAGTELPKMLAGISYRGETEHVRALLGKLRETLAGEGLADSDKSTENGIDIETLSSPDFAVFLALVDKWVFFATDKQLLLDVIARHSGKAAPGLAGTDAWINCVKHSVEEPDLTLFLSYTGLFKSLPQESGLEATLIASMGEFIPESLHTTAKIEGGGLRERTYFHYKTKLPRSAGQHRSLRFTGADTYAYLEGDYSGWDEQFAAMLAAMPIKEGIPELEKYGLTIADIPKTFGPEIAVLSDWEEGGLAMPSAVAAVELRDAEKGRKFAEMIGKEMASSGKVTESEKDGTRLWTMSFDIPIVKPTLAVNDKHLMFGLNPDSILTPVKRARAGTASLAQSETFTAARKTVAEPNGGMLYVDSARLFTRLYDRGRPFIANEIAGNPAISKFLDHSLLPKSEMFTRHLTPMIVSFHASENGYLMESTGPASYITGTLALGVAAGLAVPAFTSAKEKALEAAAMSKAKQIYLGAKLYAVDNDGKFPTKLDDLVPKYIEDAKVFSSPFSPEDPEIAFEIAEAKDTDAGDKVLIKSKFLTNGGRRIVVTVNGEVRAADE